MKYKVVSTSLFRKELKSLVKQNKNMNKLLKIVNDLSNGIKLDIKYKDHKLTKTKKYRDCRECHIEPDWLLVYRIDNNKLILLLVATGSHSELFTK